MLRNLFSRRLPYQLRIAKAVNNVVVDQPCSLHKGVADGRAHECEASALQILAHQAGFSCLGGHLRHGTPGVVTRLPADERPDIGVKAAKLSLDGQEGGGIPDGGGNFEPVADDAWI